MNVRLDVFPALLVRGDDIHRGVRVFAIESPNLIWAYEWDADTKTPDLVAFGEWAAIDQSRKRSKSWDVTLIDEDSWFVGRTGGCGCHHPFKNYDMAGLIAAMLPA